MDALDSLTKSKSLVDEFLEIYSSIIEVSKKYPNNTDIDEKRDILERLIYAKTLGFRKLIDGITYNYVDESTDEAIVEPTNLFVIARNVLELVYVYEYVFLKPDTPIKKEFAYNVYMCTGLKERLSFCDDVDYADEQIIKTVAKKDAAYEKILESEYFKGLTAQNQQKIVNKLDSKHPVYRFEFGEHDVTPVSYEEACEGIGMTGRFFNHLYAFLSTHAHPTYLSLVQFRDAYIGETPLHDGFAGLATTFLISILSILIEDARKQIPYYEEVYQRLSIGKKRTIVEHIQMTRVPKDE